MSNFIKNRGFLDPTKMFRAPQFSNVVSSKIYFYLQQFLQPRNFGNQINQPNQDASNISHTDLMANMYGVRNGENSTMGTQVLWGTNINTNDISQKLKEFLTTFMVDQTDDNIDLGASNATNVNDRYLQEPFYIKKLK